MFIYIGGIPPESSRGLSNGSYIFMTTRWCSQIRKSTLYSFLFSSRLFHPKIVVWSYLKIVFFRPALHGHHESRRRSVLKPNQGGGSVEVFRAEATPPSSFCTCGGDHTLCLCLRHQLRDAQTHATINPRLNSRYCLETKIL